VMNTRGDECQRNTTQLTCASKIPVEMRHTAGDF
jgi:hypothetical protein